MIIIIVWNEKVKKTMNLFKAIENEFKKREVNVDGIIETFNNGKEQGMVLKIYNKYNPELDMCIWAYLPNDRDYNNQMKIIVGKVSDCLKNNMWSGELDSKIITENKAIDLHRKSRDLTMDIIENNYDKKWSMKI